MDRVATKTLAEIYLKQGHLREAYEIFKILAEKDPSDPEMQKRVVEQEKIRHLEKWLANIRKQRGS
jgi:hypothetical protein